jgi:dTDP-glucose 4,6-dehydratase
VADHCRAVHLVLTTGRPGEIYNVGGGNEYPNLAIAHRLLAHLGADTSMIHRVPDRLGHDRRYALDDSKIRTELGYRPEVNFEIGLVETVAWYRDNPDWWKATRHAPTRQ